MKPKPTNPDRQSAMNLKAHFIVWTPTWTKAPEALRGRAALVAWPDRERMQDATGHVMSWGACNCFLQKADPEARKRALFIELWSIAVRDGIPPAELHRVLWPLDEYRNGLAPDIASP